LTTAFFWRLQANSSDFRCGHGLDRWHNFFSLRHRSFPTNIAVREPVSETNGNISGKVVVITGAGGSIGSALARRILQSDPALVLLLDNSEQNTYDLHSELSATTSSSLTPNPQRTNVPIVGDILDEALLNEILERHRPEVIYHAADALCVLVPEYRPSETVLNLASGHREAFQAV
jgi:UDP-N-acetylglucosamine 4,6-dehydratase